MVMVDVLCPNCGAGVELGRVLWLNVVVAVLSPAVLVFVALPIHSMLPVSLLLAVGLPAWFGIVTSLALCAIVVMIFYVIVAPIAEVRPRV
jgi:hypothetical protein